MRVVVTGSRDWGYPEVVHAALDGVLGACAAMDTSMELRHGACPTGADRAADMWALKIALWYAAVTTERFPADWNKDGRAAGPLRNIRMFDDPVDMVLAFWDGQSQGTKHTIDLAQKRNILTIIRFSPSSMDA